MSEQGSRWIGLSKLHQKAEPTVLQRGLHESQPTIKSTDGSYSIEVHRDMHSARLAFHPGNHHQQRIQCLSPRMSSLQPTVRKNLPTG